MRHYSNILYIYAYIYKIYFQIANLLNLYLIIKLKNINNITVKVQRRLILHYNTQFSNTQSHKIYKIFKILTISMIEHNIEYM